MANFQETKFYQKIQQLKKDMAPMSFAQKVDHLWYYYKTYIFVFTVLAVAVIAILGSTLSKKESITGGLMVNLTMSTEGYNYLTQEYYDRIGGGRGQEVRLDSTKFENLNMTTDVEVNYNAALTLVARVSGGLLDYALIDQSALEFYIVQDVFMDLRTFFTEEELAQLSDRLIQAKIEETGETWIAAVDITDLPFVQANVGTVNEENGKVYFALSGNPPHPEACRDIWEYLHEWE